MQCFSSLQKQKSIERRKAGARIAQSLHTRLQDEGQRSERLGERDTVVRRIRVHKIGEPSRSLPVELSGIDDYAANRRAVPADELRCGFHYDVGAPLYRSTQRRGRN